MSLKFFETFALNIQILYLLRYQQLWLNFIRNAFLRILIISSINRENGLIDAPLIIVPLVKQIQQSISQNSIMVLMDNRKVILREMSIKSASKFNSDFVNFCDQFLSIQLLLLVIINKISLNGQTNSNQLLLITVVYFLFIFFGDFFSWIFLKVPGDSKSFVRWPHIGISIGLIDKVNAHLVLNFLYAQEFHVELKDILKLKELKFA